MRVSEGRETRGVHLLAPTQIALLIRSLWDRETFIAMESYNGIISGTSAGPGNQGSDAEAEGPSRGEGAFCRTKRPEILIEPNGRHVAGTIGRDDMRRRNRGRFRSAGNAAKTDSAPRNPGFIT